MYLSVTAGLGMGGDFFIEATDPIYTGSAAIPVPNDIDTYLGDELAKHIARQMYPNPQSSAEERFDFYELHVLEINLGQTYYEQENQIFVVRYAWWLEPNKGNVGVVTTRNIFIVGDNGKTVSKVR